MARRVLRVLILEGDGIGREIVPPAVRVLEHLGKAHGVDLSLDQALVGGAAIDAAGTPLPDETLKKAMDADAILLGAVGGPKWEALDHDQKPEKGLLGLRKALGLFANLRPARVFPQLVGASSLKADVVSGIDLMVVRELTGGVYFGEPRGIEGEGPGRRGLNTMVYTEAEVERIARVAFDVARRRRGVLCSVDKANVLEVSALWREVVGRVGAEFPDVRLSHMYVDNAAMQLVRWPRQFDTIVTSNLFGDILSDEASMLTGSIGMLPSASIGERHAMYEPIHGSAPDIAGQDLANPVATILSVGMMFRHTFGLPEAEAQVERAVRRVLDQGARTADIADAGGHRIGCREMGERVLSALD